MANYYTLFSEVIEDLTPEEEAWLTKVLTIDPDKMDEAQFDDWTQNGFDGICPDTCPDCWPSFSWSISDKDRELWVYAEDCGDLENVFSVIQRFLQKFRPQAHWTIQWSESCSKPRVDAYGGGAALITAQDIKTMNTSAWLHDETTKIEKKAH